MNINQCISTLALAPAGAMLRLWAGMELTSGDWWPARAQYLGCEMLPTEILDQGVQSEAWPEFCPIPDSRQED